MPVTRDLNGMKTAQFLADTALRAFLRIEYRFAAAFYVFRIVDLGRQDQVQICGIHIAVSEDRIFCHGSKSCRKGCFARSAFTTQDDYFTGNRY